MRDQPRSGWLEAKAQTPERRENPPERMRERYTAQSLERQVGMPAPFHPLEFPHEYTPLIGRHVTENKGYGLDGPGFACRPQV